MFHVSCLKLSNRRPSFYIFINNQNLQSMTIKVHASSLYDLGNEALDSALENEMETTRLITNTRHYVGEANGTLVHTNMRI